MIRKASFESMSENKDSVQDIPGFDSDGSVSEATAFADLSASESDVLSSIFRAFDGKPGIYVLKKEDAASAGIGVALRKRSEEGVFLFSTVTGRFIAVKFFKFASGDDAADYTILSDTKC